MRPQLREELITQSIGEELAAAQALATREGLDPGEAVERLVRHAASAIRRELGAVGEDATPEEQAKWINELVAPFSDDPIVIPPEMLYGLGDPLPPRPTIPLTSSDLLFNGNGQPRIGSELKAELRSAKDVDLICAFVIRTGIRVLREELKDVVDRGGRVRVITTSYMGATDPRALNELCELGAEVRVDFDARSTKLHAKSWLIEREGGLTTAFVGSSNLSHTALLDGLEWNVRLSTADAPTVVSRVRAAFETTWENPHFEQYTPAREQELRESLKRPTTSGLEIDFSGIDVTPYRHQEQILEQLTAARERHDHHRNLIVAATGIGKTVVAAIDYRRLCEKAGRDLKLLFVAHRAEILKQAIGTYRHVLKDGTFGELLGAGERPTDGNHVFAIVNSLNDEFFSAFAADHFDVVVVDEVHHGVASMYTAFLEHFEPLELLGMTATPERMDEKDVLALFDDRVAYELRLWEAIDEGFLSPFQYFGVADETDLSIVSWTNGDYNRSELSNLLTGDDYRVGKILAAITDIVDNPEAMRALGFCVTVDHAEFMAERFTSAGLAAEAVSGNTPHDQRSKILRRLAIGELRAVFSVDVLGEGVDVPNVDTILLLRPTQSATVLTQQIGRGLRRAENKRCLTIIDPIGQHHRRFRFDRRLAALLDLTRGTALHQLENDFPYLPSGCDISLDRVATERIVQNLRDARRLDEWPAVAEDLKDLGDTSLAGFLAATQRELKDVYRTNERSWTQLRAKAGQLDLADATDDELALLRTPRRMLHIDDRERCAFFVKVLSSETAPQLAEFDERGRRLLKTLAFSLWTSRSFDSHDHALAVAWKYPRVRDELVELLTYLDDTSETVPKFSGLDPRIPLAVHARYRKLEALVAIKSADSRPNMQGGVDWTDSEKIDSLFVDINKSERDYSPTTMYNDYAISASHFHWESQSRTREDSGVGQRYIHHERDGSTVLLFMRERKEQPYWFLGPVSYVSHAGERPMSITWKLKTPMPESILAAARPL
ncbi:MAG: DUF3427 domain-containing protein [Thermoleophilaceae bacterium]|nr:DUF3427 domain-containing protein [Thermoleophilaceae bacterium]